MAVKPTHDPTDYESIIPIQNDNNDRLEMLNAITEQNYSTENIQVKTELNVAQVQAFAIGTVFANRYKNKLIKELIDEIMKNNLSKNRQSRKESIDVAKSMLGSQVETERSNDLKTRLIGG